MLCTYQYTLVHIKFKLGVCSTVMAELWGVFTGLELAHNLQFQKVMVECDSAAVVTLINKVQDDDQEVSSLLTDICQIVKKFSMVIVSHMYREKVTLVLMP